MTTIDTKSEAKPNSAEVRVLRAATCPSLSGKSKLTYELGCDDKAALQLRIAKNSGKGMFSAAWVPWERVGALLEGHGDKPVTSHSLWPLFKGTSVNTAGFLLAALKQEGLVRELEGKARGYRRLDPKPFLGEARALMGNGSVRKGPVRASPRPGNGSVAAPGAMAARATATISPAASQVGLPTTNGSGKKPGGSKAGLAEDVVRLLATGSVSKTRPSPGATAKKPSKAIKSAKTARPKAVKAVKPVPVTKKASAGRR